MISDVPPAERASLEPILEESFEGWYLRHATKTLHEIELVRGASLGGRVVGLTMLKSLGDGIGYVYYIAVAKDFRRRGLGKKLLEDALSYFASTRVREVYASVENDEGAALFVSKGFRRTDFSDVSKKYGLLRAMSMYRSMLAVPGELLLKIELAEKERA